MVREKRSRISILDKIGICLHHESAMRGCKVVPFANEAILNLKDPTDVFGLATAVVDINSCFSNFFESERQIFKVRVVLPGVFEELFEKHFITRDPLDGHDQECCQIAACHSRMAIRSRQEVCQLLVLFFFFLKGCNAIGIGITVLSVHLEKCALLDKDVAHTLASLRFIPRFQSLIEQVEEL